MVPPKGAKRASIPGALKRFCRRYWPSDRTPLQVNLQRKHFHNTLMKMTETEEKFKEVFIYNPFLFFGLLSLCFILRPLVPPGFSRSPGFFLAAFWVICLKPFQHLLAVFPPCPSICLLASPGSSCRPAFFWFPWVFLGI